MDHSQHKQHNESAAKVDHSKHAGHNMPANSGQMSPSEVSGHSMQMGHHHQGFGGLDLGGAILSFVIFGVWFARRIGKKGKAPTISAWRFDLFKIPGLQAMVKSKYFSFGIRLIPALLFILVIAAGLFGEKRNNLAAPFTWLFWWTILIFFVAFGGKIFCSVCPWDFFANLFQFSWFHKTKKNVQSLNLKWPKILSNIYPAIILFILVTWLELGFDITRNGYATAIMGLILVGTAIFAALIFEKRGFCRYACPVGRISGLYSQFSPIELRTKDTDVCRTCKTKECIRGTETTTPCPTGEIPFKLNQNTYCTLCTECVRSCDKDNLTLKLRAPGSDLTHIKTSRKDESVLALVMLILTFFHGLTMTQHWFDITGSVSRAFQFTYVQSFSVVMGLLLLAGFVVYRGFEVLIKKALGWNRFAFALTFAFIPLTLGYHLGHNGMHLFGEALYLLPPMNDPFGWGWNLLGLADFKPFTLMNHSSLRIFQVVVIAVGFYYSTKILRIRSEQMTEKPSEVRWLYYSHYVLLILLGSLALWFVNQPMVMKSGI